MRQRPFDILTGERVYGQPVGVSAGEFVSDALMSVPRFAASPEALETIRRIKEKHGLDVEVLPIFSNNSGIYFYSGPGGHYDKEKRTVGLNVTNPSQFVSQSRSGSIFSKNRRSISFSASAALGR